MTVRVRGLSVEGDERGGHRHAPALLRREFKRPYFCIVGQYKAAGASGTAPAARVNGELTGGHNDEAYGHIHGSDVVKVIREPERQPGRRHSV